MKKCRLIFFPVLIAAGSLLLSGCGTEERVAQSRGFHLPEGDAVVGQGLFVKFDCVYCHTVAGVELAATGGPEGPPKIPLGGEVNRVRSYGELVTSIINPEHVISPQYLAILSKPEKEGDVASPMPVYNEEMTVGQLVDVAAFLHSRYRLIEPSLDNYHYTTP
ncbi:MAG: c-type cytochrome [Verrucomicrobiales bacterium]|nr:c-type cytochrome [Verrucomicrobiales bacterium]